MATAYLSRTAGTPTNSDKWTFSTWVKSAWSSGNEGTLIGTRVDANNYEFVGFDSQPRLRHYLHYSGSASGQLKTTAKYRDYSAWYHVVYVWDSGNADASLRQRMYVNGVELSAFDTDDNAALNQDSLINTSGNTVYIGVSNTADANSFFQGSLAHTHFCDGQAYAASDFGETDSTSGIWVAKTSPSVTYGNNGFFLKYASGASGTDSSGNGNNMTVSGTLTNLKDTPDDNFCTMNPLSAGVINGAGMALTNSNTTIYDGDANWRSGFGTLGDNQGKYYFEAKMVGSSTNWWIGFLDARQVVKGEYKFTEYTRGYGVAGGGQRGNSNSEVSWGVTYAQNDIAMCALDLDNGKIYFGKNGTWSESGDPTSGSTGTGAAYSVTTDCIYLPAVSLYDTTAGMSLNFGNGYFGTTAVASAGTNASGIGTFEYDVPTGYTAVSTLGLME